jgi:hypothetical protein
MLVTLFLGVPYRLISFFPIYIVLPASLSTGVRVYIGVTIRVTDGI